MGIKTNTIALLALSQTLYGCSTVSYKNPDSGPTSNVRFALEAPPGTDGWLGPTFGVILYNYTSKECEGESQWMNLSEFGALNNPRRSLNIPLNQYTKSAAKEIKVVAGKDSYFLFKSNATQPGGYSSKITSCGVPFQANFKDGASYEVVFQEPRFGSCSVKFSEIVSEDGNFKRKFIKRFESDKTETTAGCKKAFGKTRWL